MGFFDDDQVHLDILKKRAYNLRWAEVEDGVIPLTAADPDFSPAPEIVEAMEEYVKDACFSYTPKLGYEGFREGVSQALLKRKGEEIRPEHILAVDSAARGMYIIAKAVLQPGDEMIVFDPCDFLFRESALAAGATPVMYPARLKDGRIDLSELERYITPKTKMIGLCNPHNPYGKVYTLEQLDFLMKLCEKYHLYIMNDEIWSDIIYPDAEFTSIYSLGNERCQRVLSVFGFSKSFGLAALRIGCVYCTEQKLFDRLVECSDVLSTAGGACSISQIAAEAAVKKCYYWVDEFMKHLTANRDYAVDFINGIPGLKAYRPEGTYLLYVDISELGVSGAEFTEYLRNTVKLSLVPGGRQFFGEQSEGHIRICLATSRGILEEGMRRLKEGTELFHVQSCST